MPHKTRDLFDPTVRVDKLSPLFRLAALQPGHEAARALINEIYANFHDVDGSFVREFQTGGFSARVLELALFAYLEEADLDLDRGATAPDYVLRGQHPVAIEVTTTNPAQGTAFDASTPPDLLPPDLPAADRQFVFQVAKAIRRKLLHSDAQGRPYWEQPHVQGLPFVVAVGAFHNEHAQFEPDGLVSNYLYGLTQTLSHDNTGSRVLTQEKIEFHEFNGKTIPSALFQQPEAADLSGVLFSNQHTIAKFNRIGTEQGLGHPDTALVRFGTSYDSSPDAIEPHQFVYTVGRQPASYRETFAQGLHLFINPGRGFPWTLRPSPASSTAASMPTASSCPRFPRDSTLYSPRPRYSTVRAHSRPRRSSIATSRLRSMPRTARGSSGHPKRVTTAE
ncbi:hypothetical protein GCM10027199_08890 [Amycolatopsis magusensis]